MKTIKKEKDEDKLCHQLKVQHKLCPSPLENLESDHTSSLRLCFPNNKLHPTVLTPINDNDLLLFCLYEKESEDINARQKIKLLPANEVS